MRVLVYPHDLAVGGSQTNAIDLAAAVQKLGHECIVFGRPGSLCARLDELGLEFIESPNPGRRPSLRVVRVLRDLVAQRGIDVIHGYEWPPGLEADMAARSAPGVAAVCTVMSMAVAPFLPLSLPLVVGTRQIAAHEHAGLRHSVSLIQPPVGLEHNVPPSARALDAFRERWHLDGRPLIVCVSRLATELKSEGILTAVKVAEDLAKENPFQLLIVGDGAAHSQISEAAEAANERTGMKTVVLTGELADPSVAYAVADVALGMGGSALRALAYSKPLIVQGENGFFVTLKPDTADIFRWQGWYGVGSSVESGRRRLTDELIPLLSDAGMRRDLGSFGREVVKEFSLRRAAESQVKVYEGALAGRAERRSDRREMFRSGIGFAHYYAGRRMARVLGRDRLDDFNAKPIAAAELVGVDGPKRAYTEGDPSEPLIYFSGVNWNSTAGTDRNLVSALARTRQMVWVDPPVSILRRNDERLSALSVSKPAPNIVRLSVLGPPGISRPAVRALARHWQVAALRRYLLHEQLRPCAIVVATPEPVLPYLGDMPGVKVYFATDDFVEAAPLWGMSAAYLRRAREANLAAADVVLAVTPALSQHLQRGPRPPVWFPNGADLARFRNVGSTAVAAGVSLKSPIAGVVGQFNERTDLDYLRAVQAAEVSLLLVGPASFRRRSSEQAFDDLTGLAGVQWVGAVPREDLPGFYRLLDVGLTPYANTSFNQRSYPLKTVEYLAAGVPVVTTDVAPLDGLDQRFVKRAVSVADFVAKVEFVCSEIPQRAAIQHSVEMFDWDTRAADFLCCLQGWAQCGTD